MVNIWPQSHTYQGLVLIPASMVETNVAIMVASMPACASFLRHFFSQARLLSSIKSRLASIKRKKYPKPTTSTNSVSPTDDTGNGFSRFTAGGDGDQPGKGSKGKSWNFRNLFERGDVPPQLTSAKRESGHILESCDSNLSSVNTSSERGEKSWEQEEKGAASDDVV